MEGTAQSTPSGLACNLPLLAPVPAPREGADEIETEVMSLFEPHRTPLLRYAVFFGVPVPDSKEMMRRLSRG